MSRDKHADRMEHGVCRHCGEAIERRYWGDTESYQTWHHVRSSLIACRVTKADPEVSA